MPPGLNSFKHPEWLKAFGPDSVVQEPSWGVVAYHIPVKSMKLSPETMVEVAAEVLRQNDCGEDARIQYLGWLTRPGIRAEGSILIEFASPVVAVLSSLVSYGGSKSTMLRASAAKDGRSCAGNAKNRGISSHTVPTPSNVAIVPVRIRSGSGRRQGARRYQSNVPILAEGTAQSVGIAR